MDKKSTIVLITCFSFLSMAIEGNLFSCVGKPAGYYADMDTNCQKYYVCGGSGRISTQSCPKGTKFRQKMQICDHSYLVDCTISEQDFPVPSNNDLEYSQDTDTKLKGKNASQHGMDQSQRSAKSAGTTFTLLDTRTLFFVPDNATDEIKETRRILISLNLDVIFRTKTVLGDNFQSCPEYCYRPLMNPNTCQPCVRIK